jgi:hypothetical protein
MSQTNFRIERSSVGRTKTVASGPFAPAQLRSHSICSNPPAARSLPMALFLHRLKPIPICLGRLQLRGCSGCRSPSKTDEMGWQYRGKRWPILQAIRKVSIMHSLESTRRPRNKSSSAIMTVIDSFSDWANLEHSGPAKTRIIKSRNRQRLDERS